MNTPNALALRSARRASVRVPGSPVAERRGTRHELLSARAFSPERSGGENA